MIASDWIKWTSHLRNGESYLISTDVVLSCHIQRYEEIPETVLVDRGVDCIFAAQHESKEKLSVDLCNILHMMPKANCLDHSEVNVNAHLIADRARD